MAFYFNGNCRTRFYNGIFTTHPSEYTLSAWVKAVDTGFRGIIVRSAGNPAAGWSHTMELVTNLYFRNYTYDGTPRTITADAPVIVNTWNHVVCTAKSGGSMYLYVNGIQACAPFGTLGTLWQGGNDFWVGSDDGYTTSNFLGGLADVAIWYKQFTDAEVRQLYSGGIARMPLQIQRKSLALYLPMDDVEINKYTLSSPWYDGVNGGFTQTLTTGTNTARGYPSPLSYP